MTIENMTYADLRETLVKEKDKAEGAKLIERWNKRWAETRGKYRPDPTGAEWKARFIGVPEPKAPTGASKPS